jgi:sugar (pentulose or hexulose) kinase
LSLLGIDLGTTGIKCAAYDEDGKMLEEITKQILSRLKK